MKLKMEAYVDHLSNIIRKSTFRLTKYVDGFITPKGEWISIKSHHHVEKALEIISDTDMTSFYEEWIEKYTEALNNLLKAKEELPKTGKTLDNLKLIESGWYIDIISSYSIEKLIKYVDEKIESTKEDLDYSIKRLNEEKDNGVLAVFKKINKNKGYDAAEFVIVNLGYIAVENGYLLYKDAKRSQVLDYNLTVETDESNRPVIIQLTQEEIEEKENKERKRLIDLASWYQESEHRFHCPSGFVRYDYKRWCSQCRKIGLDPDQLVYGYRDIC